MENLALDADRSTGNDFDLWLLTCICLLYYFQFQQWYGMYQMYIRQTQCHTFYSKWIGWSSGRFPHNLISIKMCHFAQSIARNHTKCTQCPTLWTDWNDQQTMFSNTCRMTLNDGRIVINFVIAFELKWNASD